ncbi:cell surface protein [Treponema primitia ZAS-2]|uniref:Cell surface protein n=1 Tax=Treponema primitia (strain ATCC BAA-887 / DSM 12427 / ZAS-2) TaxID=545694 RepID=F5YP40_TREPZ|nr:leucine-rich repeat protein [Treponema primitia]AEF84367.1 cell surface protein [Treponema primitia ZAS-2]
MKKLIILALLLSAAFTLYAGGGKEKPAQQAAPDSTPAAVQPGNRTQQAASAPTPAQPANGTQQATPLPDASPVPPPPPVPQNPYYDGDGSKGTSLAILIPEGKNLSVAEAYLPTLVQGVFVGDLSKFSAISVLDRQSLEKVLTETESGIYKSAEDYSHIGEIANVGYVLTGALTKTASGFALQVQITDTASAVTKASYSGACTAGELDNFTGIKKASLDLLTQMGVALTAKGREELTGAGAQQAINGETALAKGITAQKSGTVVETLAYYFQAASIDPSLSEAVSRASVMSADISSGNIGENTRNDIAWRRAWLTRLTETENYLRNYVKTPAVPYDLVYSTDLQTGAVNYANETVPISFEIELLPASTVWLDTMEKLVNTIKVGLEATGKTGDWGLSDWPVKTVTQGADFFTKRHSAFTIVAELVNEKGISLGRESIILPYGWFFDVKLEEGKRWEKKRLINPLTIIPEPIVTNLVLFPAVKADLITDKLTMKMVSVDGIAAETAGRDGHIMITTKEEYLQLPRGNFLTEARTARNKLFGFERGKITRYSSPLEDIAIPSSIDGIPVTSISWNELNLREVTSIAIPNSITAIGYNLYGSGALNGGKLTSVIIPNSITSIENNAFANNKLTDVIIPNGITSIEGGAFSRNQLTSITISNSVTSIGAVAFAGNLLTTVTIGGGVKLDTNLAYNNSISGFDGFYERQGKRAGTYTYDGKNWTRR